MNNNSIDFTKIINIIVILACLGLIIYFVTIIIHPDPPEIVSVTVPEPIQHSAVKYASNSIDEFIITYISNVIVQYDDKWQTNYFTNTYHDYKIIRKMDGCEMIDTKTMPHIFNYLEPGHNVFILNGNTYVGGVSPFTNDKTIAKDIARSTAELNLKIYTGLIRINYLSIKNGESEIYENLNYPDMDKIANSVDELLTYCYGKDCDGDRSFQAASIYKVDTEKLFTIDYFSELPPEYREHISDMQSQSELATEVLEDHTEDLLDRFVQLPSELVESIVYGIVLENDRPDLSVSNYRIAYDIIRNSLTNLPRSEDVPDEDEEENPELLPKQSTNTEEISEVINTNHTNQTNRCEEQTTSNQSIYAKYVQKDLYNRVVDGASNRGYVFITTSTACTDAASVSFLDALLWCNAYSESNGLQPLYYISNQTDSGVPLTNTNQVIPGSVIYQIESNGFRLPNTNEITNPINNNAYFEFYFDGPVTLTSGITQSVNCKTNEANCISVNANSSSDEAQFFRIISNETD